MSGLRRNADSYAAYRAVAGLGASPQEFMSMALDSLRASLRRADQAIRSGASTEKADALNSAGKLVEFLIGLSGIEHGELSDRLASIYQFVMSAILKANAQNDLDALADGRQAIEHVATIWRNIFDGVEERAV
ncbi:MAG TPA: flagellar protein FliS [Xanthobacteraceae bacterium]|nr:flagellar protein FliS [Xanthobacteraceae bacterium]